MSLLDQSFPPRELGLHEDLDKPYNNGTAPSKAAEEYPSSDTADILDEFYGTSGEDVMASTDKKAAAPVEPPALPAKSALRASRILDLSNFKLLAAPQAAATTTTTATTPTPHDAYLSSEEDASSSADDFSDFEYDLTSEGSASSRCNSISHEDIAKVVSVIFSGKPLLIDLSPTRQSAMTPVSEGRQSMSTSSSPASSTRRPSTSSQSTAASSVTTRSSVVVAPTASKENVHDKFQASAMPKRPLFLNIDPFANGSTYSLDMPANLDQAAPREEETPKTPKSPTVFRRTFSLVRKRSKSILGNNSKEQIGEATGPAAATSMTISPLERVESADEEDVFRSAIKRNAQQQRPHITPPALPQTSQQPQSPASPAEGKRGILAGLAARRRSIKITGKMTL